jgi:hypothetical protein
MAQQPIVLNGINGATGGPLTPNLSLADVAAVARGEPPPDRPIRRWLQAIWQLLTKGRDYLALPRDIDGADVAKAGWAVVFAANTPQDVRTALEPLIEHRQRHVAPDRCKILEHRPEDRAVRGWLQRPPHNADLGSELPWKVPYYLLLVGGPDVIPFDFQYTLDIDYAVGRLCFETPEQYRQYADSVVAYENKRTERNVREIVYWAPRHDGPGQNRDPATQLSHDWLVTPLACGVKAHEGQPAEEAVAAKVGYGQRLFLGGTANFSETPSEPANKANLCDVLRPPAGKRPPALLFTASHGLAWPLDDPRHPQTQGALLCQDYPEGDPYAGEKQPGDYLAAEDVTDDANVQGLVAFLYACFGAGTPQFNTFDRRPQRQQFARNPFVSRLPQRLLSHPRGAALAVLGHVDQGWGYSIQPYERVGAAVRPLANVGPQLTPFRNLLDDILRGIPVGHATRDLSAKYARLSHELTLLRDAAQGQAPPSDADLAYAWLECADYQNYVLLGDPAVRLLPDRLQ